MRAVTRSTASPASSGRAVGRLAIAAGALALALAALTLAGLAREADAVILPASTIDGPSEDIVGFGGIAMAEDGTGGVVYLKRVGGVAHVFVARYAEGHWLAPIRVDTGEPFAASWPRIGAANGGELVVVWATPFATEGGHPVDELLSATLGPGASSFGSSMIVDPDIRAAAGTSPIARDELDGAGRCRLPGDRERRRAEHEHSAAAAGRRRRGRAPGTLRRRTLDAARRDQSRSGRLDAAARRKQMRRSSRSARPATGSSSGRSQTSTASRGSGPGGCSGSTLDYVLPVSATSFAGAPIGDDADAPSRFDLSPRAGSRRLSAGRRPRLAVAWTADLPQHAARWRIC